MSCLTHHLNVKLRRSLLFSLALAFALTVLGWRVGNRKSGAITHASDKGVATVSVRAEGQGGPRINFQNGQEWPADYRGEPFAVTALAEGKATSRALASADFDEDGTPDLVAAYALTDGSSAVVLWRGNVDAVYANAPEAQARRANGTFTAAPYLATAQVFRTGGADFVAAGDFDADGHWDLVTATRGGAVLFWLAGNGKGGFDATRTIDATGRVTALVAGEINLRDGLTDIVVGLARDNGPAIAIYEGPQGALRGTPEVFAMPGPVNSLALGRLDEDGTIDLAVAAGDALVLLHGRDRRLSLDESLRLKARPARLESRAFPGWLKALAIGDYQGNDANEIALLGFAGTLQVLHTHPRRNVGLGTREKLAQWSEITLEGRFATGAAQLVTTRVAAQNEDTLIVLDEAGAQLQIVAAPGEQQKSAGQAQATWAVSGSPVAALPLRLNSDAISDLVILRADAVAPVLLASRPAAIFTVTNTNDSGTGSLRQALMDANANPDADMIAFDIAGRGVKTITPASDLPSLTSTATIDATTQPNYTGTPLIEITARGLVIEGSSPVIRGLVINRIIPGPPALHFRNGGNGIVEGNFIGTDAAGSAIFCTDYACTNVGSGITLGNHFSNPAGVSGFLLGGTVEAARNVITGNSSELIIGRGSDNTIRGNYIGLNAAGTGRPPAPLGSSFSFPTIVGLYRTTNTTFGGTLAGARNIIVGSTYGVFISDQTSDTAISSGGTVIQGNYFGTDATGTQRIEVPTNSGLVIPGIYCEGGGLFSTRSTTGPIIGGTTPSARNIGALGVGLRGPYTVAPLRVQGNYIGTDVTGNVGLARVAGFSWDESQNSVIGGNVPEAGNIIANIAGNAIYFDEVNTSLFTFLGPNFVQGNSIGVNAAGQCLGNSMDGIFLQIRAPQQVIKDNTIACNGRYGVRLPVESEPPGTAGMSPRRIRIENNRIYNNAVMGLDLGAAGVTPNDDGDSDSGANDLQNFPTLTSITTQPQPSAPTASTIGGTLNSQANGTYLINWYFSAADTTCASNQSRQPVLSAGSVSATTDGSGNASFSFPFTFPAGRTVGNMNATATDSNGNTSEFSPCFLVTDPSSEQGVSLQFSAQIYTTNEASNVVILVTRSGDATSPVSVDYATGVGTASQRTDYTALAGTLNFAAGETSKSFAIPINDDLYPEGTETIPLTLTNPTNGAVVGPRGLATVNITDNDPGAAGQIYVARLNSRQVVPPNTSPGTGYATVVVNGNNTEAVITLNYSGTVGIQQSLHLHGPAPFGMNGPIIGNSFSPFTVTPTQLEQLRGSLLYIDVHTSIGGPETPEIRGQIVPNPVEDLGYFVQQQYADFLGREPDLAGLNYWSEELLGCARTSGCSLGQRRYQISHAFFYELEFQQTGAYVYRLYRAAYGNNQPAPNPQTAQLPNYNNFSSDRARVVGGTSLAQAQQALANAFVARPEFLARYPARLTAGQFVDSLLANILAGSGADLSGQRDALLTLYNGNATNPRGAVLYRLADDNANNPINNRAFINAEYARAFVATQYFGYLRRDPDAAGYNFWLDVINRFPINDTRGQYAMVCAFITSREYQERFSALSPRTNQECPPAP